MGELTKHFIVLLEGGGEPARQVLQQVGELLRKVWQPGFTPFGETLQQEEITAEDAVRLRDALTVYYTSESDVSARRTAVSILAKEGRPELREQLVAELRNLLTEHRVLSRELFQLLLGLEDIGESVYPQGVRVREVTAVDINVKAASDYLVKQGILVPWQ